MTIDEAIRTLTDLKAWGGFGNYCTDEIEALDMAISALRFKREAEPFECEEYESCEFNASAICRLPYGWKCPHGLRGVEAGEAIEGMCCDCAHGGPCCDFSENVGCENRKDDGSCWRPCVAAEKNEPLKLDELLTMDGKPVWCVGGNGNACWCLICVRRDKGCVFMDAVDNETGLWDGDYYGMTGDGKHGLHLLGWISYRRPPVKGESNG